MTVHPVCRDSAVRVLECDGLKAGWRIMCGRALALVVCLAVCLLPLGCASDPDEVEDPLKLASLTLRMDQRANENWPARIELVRVEDMSLVKELVGTSASDWFGTAGTAFRNAHPDARYDYWELVPGTLLGPIEVKARGRLAGVLFCDTRSPQPPLRLERHRHASIAVDVDGCTVTSEDGGRSRLGRMGSWVGGLLGGLGGLLGTMFGWLIP